MKILHISTYDNGGAGNAAMRLHQGLTLLNINSKFLTLHANNFDLSEQYPEKEKIRYYNRYLKKIGLLRSQNVLNQKRLNKTKGDFEYLSFPRTDYRVENHRLIQEADIINLHWVANFINYPTFFKTIDKPIVWTIHDMNAFLGVFHYLNDVINNPQLSGLEQKYKEIKGKSVNNKNITVVSPSKWLMEESQKSEVLGSFKHINIPYGLDTSLFKSMDKNRARDILNLPQNKRILLFLSQNIANKRKGFHLLRDAINQLDIPEDILFCAVGKKSVTIPDNIIHLDYVNDVRLLPIVFSAADVFILPSLEDNLPNTMLESLACGTPVICYPTGGMLDAVNTGKNGIIANNIDVKSLAEALLAFISNKYSFNKTEIRKIAEEKYSLKIQAEKYKSLYQSLLFETA